MITKPMLCHRYADHRLRLSYPVWMQPKLNGIRMLYGNGILRSRSHGRVDAKTWPDHRLEHLRSALSIFSPDIVLDGELYVHGWSLQKINGSASINALEDREDTSKLQYHIFDCFFHSDPTLSFDDRRAAFNCFFTPLHPPLFHVSSSYVTSEFAGDQLYRHHKSQGYEGSIYRDSRAAYGQVEHCGNKENRWKTILKRKDWLDAEFECLAALEGEGKYANSVGALQFETCQGLSFTCGSGLTDAERQDYWANPPTGHLFRIRYEALSDDGIPLQPRIECAL